MVVSKHCQFQSLPCFGDPLGNMYGSPIFSALPWFQKERDWLCPLLSSASFLHAPTNSESQTFPKGFQSKVPPTVSPFCKDLTLVLLMPWEQSQAGGVGRERNCSNPGAYFRFTFYPSYIQNPILTLQMSPCFLLW